MYDIAPRKFLVSLEALPITTADIMATWATSSCPGEARPIHSGLCGDGEGTEYEGMERIPPPQTHPYPPPAAASLVPALSSLVKCLQ